MSDQFLDRTLPADMQGLDEPIGDVIINATHRMARFVRIYINDKKQPEDLVFMVNLTQGFLLTYIKEETIDHRGETRDLIKSTDDGKPELKEVRYEKIVVSVSHDLPLDQVPKHWLPWVIHPAMFQGPPDEKLPMFGSDEPPDSPSGTTQGELPGMSSMMDAFRQFREEEDQRRSAAEEQIQGPPGEAGEPGQPSQSELERYQEFIRTIEELEEHVRTHRQVLDEEEGYNEERRRELVEHYRQVRERAWPSVPDQPLWYVTDHSGSPPPGAGDSSSVDPNSLLYYGSSSAPSSGSSSASRSSESEPRAMFMSEEDMQPARQFGEPGIPMSEALVSSFQQFGDNELPTPLQPTMPEASREDHEANEARLRQMEGLMGRLQSEAPSVGLAGAFFGGGLAAGLPNRNGDAFDPEALRVALSNAGEQLRADLNVPAGTQDVDVLNVRMQEALSDYIGQPVTEETMARMQNELEQIMEQHQRDEFTTAASTRRREYWGPNVMMLGNPQLDWDVVHRALFDLMVEMLLDGWAWLNHPAPLTSARRTGELGRLCEQHLNNVGQQHTQITRNPETGRPEAANRGAWTERARQLGEELDGTLVQMAAFTEMLAMSLVSQQNLVAIRDAVMVHVAGGNSNEDRRVGIFSFFRERHLHHIQEARSVQSAEEAAPDWARDEEEVPF